MTSLAEYRVMVDNRLQQSIASSNWLEAAVPAEFCSEFLDPAQSLLAHGKRTRAAFLAAGWQLFTPNTEFSAVVDAKSDKSGKSRSTHAILPVTAGTAVELYQASALIHDDIIDAALSRRGLPATHIAFTNTHETAELTGDAAKFGLNSAILLGDLLLSLAALTFAQAEHTSNEGFAVATTLFHRMTAEVAYGQYLDNRREFTAFSQEFDADIAQAYRVLYHKSARYSVDCPLKIGAALAGATQEEIAQLSAIGIPLGEAFQLRDDQLGVFGDESATGKPSGGDLIEGKRTVLLGLTRKMADPDEQQFLDAHIGKPLSAAEITQIRQIIKSCGADAAHEAMITEREQQASQAIERLPQQSEILQELFTQLSARIA